MKSGARTDLGQKCPRSELSIDQAAELMSNEAIGRRAFTPRPLPFPA